MNSAQDYATNLLGAKIASQTARRPLRNPKVKYEPMLDHHVVADHRGLPVPVSMTRATPLPHGKTYDNKGSREAARRLKRMNKS